LLNVAFLFGSIPWWPKTGAPNELEIQIMSAVPICFVFGALAAIFLGFSWLMTTMGPTDIAWIPNRDYWTKEENFSITVQRIRYSFEFSGVAMMLFALIVQWEDLRCSLNISKHVSDAVDELILVEFSAFIALIVIVIFKNIRLLRSFRLPKEQNNEINTL
jgi:hypothetical protein